MSIVDPPKKYFLMNSITNDSMPSLYERMDKLNTDLAKKDKEALERTKKLSRVCPRNYDFHSRQTCDLKVCEYKQLCDAEREEKYNPIKMILKTPENAEASDYFVDDKFRPDKMVTEIVCLNDFVLVEDEEQNELYYFDVEKGLWRQNAKDYINALTRDMLAQRWTRYYSKEVYNNLKDYLFKKYRVPRKEFEPPLRLLNLKNGVYDLTEEKFYKGKTEKKPEYYFTFEIPVNYDETAECPKIVKFFNEVVSDPNDRLVLEEIPGYMLYRDYPIHRIFLGIGSGGNGKGTYCGLLTSFLGQENVTARSLQDLTTNRFAKSSLYKKHACIQPDMSNKIIYDTSTFKSLSGNDLISAEKKFGNSFEYINFAKIWVTMNEAPPINDDTDSLYRRLNIVNFDNSFIGKENTKLLDELTTDKELSGLLNLAIKALKERVLENRGFSNDEKPTVMREEYLRKSDPVWSFCEDRVQKNPEGHVVKARMWSDFLTYCSEKGLPKISEKRYRKLLCEHLGYIKEDRVSYKIDKSRPRAWFGISLSGMDLPKEKSQTTF